MKYIKLYNESLKSNILLSTLTLFQLLPKYNDDKDIIYLMNSMKDQNSKPSIIIENKIDLLRKHLINEIEQSNFNYKKELKDSINNIPIFIVDLSKIANGSTKGGGCQIFFNNLDIKKNVIFIDKNVDNEQITNIILHEFYHFISKYEKFDNSIYIDKKSLLDNNWLLNKLSIIITNKNFKELPNNQQISIKNICDDFIKEKNYLTSKEEFNVRLLEMKNWLISKNRINNISDKLKKSDLDFILNNKNDKNAANFLDILPFLDFNKYFE